MWWSARSRNPVECKVEVPLRAQEKTVPQRQTPLAGYAFTDIANQSIRPTDEVKFTVIR